jgi:hypothetical protein
VLVLLLVLPLLVPLPLLVLPLLVLPLLVLVLPPSSLVLVPVALGPGSHRPSTTWQRALPQHDASSKHHRVRSSISMHASMHPPWPMGGSLPGS